MTQDSLVGVHSLELIPDIGRANISPRILQTIGHAICMKAAIAYWTTLPSNLTANVTKLLGCADSFLCVDIHLPTNICALSSMVKSGAAIHLHLAKLARMRTGYSFGMPPHLLHPKLLLFDLPNNQAEVWIGSHNWTPRAIHGPNIEASIVLSMEKNAPIYRQTDHFLTTVKNRFCAVMDANRADYYLRLQRAEEGERAWTVELEGDNVGNLDGEIIRIFGTDQGDLDQLRTVGKSVFVQISDSQTTGEYIYSGLIKQLGELRALTPGVGSLRFPKGRWAHRRGRRYPSLQPAAEPPQPMVDSSFYFVTIQIIKRSPVDLRESLGASLWTADRTSPLIERMDDDSLAMFRGPSCIRLPAPVDSLDVSPVPLVERRKLGEVPLVSRKVVYRKNTDVELTG